MIRRSAFVRVRGASWLLRGARIGMQSGGVRCVATNTTLVGDVQVVVPSNNADGARLVPRGYLSQLPSSSIEVMETMRWLAQKYELKQDAVLLGHTGPLRRHIALAFCEACEIPVESIRLSRDTTEADLKQRRELQAGQSVVFHDQAPVRAALHGRLLLLEGLEQCERNVLPTLNNLLENREMQLEDGRFLGSSALPVHPSFRILAISLQVPPYAPGQTIDPPLRSRFQSRFVDELGTETLLEHFVSRGNEHQQGLKALLSFYETLRLLRSTAIKEGVSLSGLPIFSLQHLRRCLEDVQNGHLLSETLERIVPAVSHFSHSLNPHLVRPIVGSAWSEFKQQVAFLPRQKQRSKATLATATMQQGIRLTRSQQAAFQAICEDVGSKHIALLAPRGSGKSVLARALAKERKQYANVFPCSAELTARDLLQRRHTNVDGSTGWFDSPLVGAARAGNMCVLDGFDRLDTHALVVLQRLLQDNVINLPSGEELTAHKNFTCLVLALPPTEHRPEDTRERHICADLALSYHHLPPTTPLEMLEALQVPASSPLAKVFSSLNAAASGEGFSELALSLRHLVRLKKLEHQNSNTLRTALEGTLLIRFLPETTKLRFQQALKEAGISSAQNAPPSPLPSPPPNHLEPKIIQGEEGGGMLQIGNVVVPRRKPSNPFLVPRPLWYSNAVQNELLQDLLFAYSKNESATLLIGNQGVGKNKLVDQLLCLLNAEREYLQLHRDTTTQSLTLVPTLEEGKISYEDSVVVKAARAGRVLVVDEADKAPLEVVVVLKMLAEDGELVLADGRRLLSRERWAQEQGDDAAPLRENDPSIVWIHPNFRMFVLANRPGFPFLGNNFFRECGDVFNVHIVDNLDRKSELALLKSYGPNVDGGVLKRLATAFGRLREQEEKGNLMYPFSSREAVSVVKHLEAFPHDGVATAVENVVGFDALTPTVRAQVAEVFQDVGVPLSTTLQSTTGLERPPIHLAAPVSLPPPRVIPMGKKGGKSATSLFPLHVQAMNKSDWNVVQSSDRPLHVASSRFTLFSELIGTIQLGREQDEAMGMARRTRVCGMTAQANNHLHVCTISPLELHTCKDLGKSLLSTLSSSSSSSSSSANANAVEAELEDDASIGASSHYSRIELLSEEMAWRLGMAHSASSKPLLVTLLKGAAVLLPDLSMAVAVEWTKESAAPTTTMYTLPGLGKGEGAGGSKGGAGEWCVASFEPSQATSSGDQAIYPSSVLWWKGSRDLSFISFPYTLMGKVRLEQGVESVSKIGGGDDNKWLVKTTEGKLVEISLPDLKQHHQVNQKPQSFFAKTFTSSSSSASSSLAASVSLDELEPTGLTADTAQTCSTFLFGGAGEVTLSSSSSSSSTLFGGNRKAYASTLSASALEVWQRIDDASSSSSSSSSSISTSSHGNVHSIVNGGRTLEVVCTNISPPASSSSPNSSSSQDASPQLRSILLDKHTVLDETKKKSNKNSNKKDVKDVCCIASLANGKIAALCDTGGLVSLYETDSEALAASRKTWENMYGDDAAPRDGEGEGGKGKRVPRKAWTITRQGVREADKTSTPRTGLDRPKHGKEDPKNEPHVGGNTWAGGTGGSDTAGLGGRGGPYRLDKGHTVHQVSDKMKAEVSKEAREAAAQAAKLALANRLEEINMRKGEFDVYEAYRQKVSGEITQLKALFDEIARRAKERVWLRGQATGELDDSRLVDGLAGDALVYKRRGIPEYQTGANDARGGQAAPSNKRLHFLMDVSGSMYRFNGQDARLQRLLEVSLLVMESISTKNNAEIEYAITGHSGDSSEIEFLDFKQAKPGNESERFKVLESMAAHAQFCESGDNTLRGTERAIAATLAGADEQTEKYVFVVSDANFERYGISPQMISKALMKDRRVQTHLILIASLGREAQEIKDALPAGRVHISYSTSDLVGIFKTILKSVVGTGV